jgi:hypothetical protein
MTPIQEREGGPDQALGDMTMTNTPPSIPTTSNKMEHLSSQAAPVHVFDGLIMRRRAKKLHQEVHVVFYEIPFINENYILTKLCMFLLLSFTRRMTRTHQD